MIAFGRTCAAIVATASKLEKIALVANYLRELDDADLAPATRYFTGNPFPQSQERSLAVGWRTIVAAASTTWGVDDAALGVAYRATGDLGAALGPFVRPSHDLGLFREPLTPAGLYVAFDRDRRRDREERAETPPHPVRAHLLGVHGPARSDVRDQDHDGRAADRLARRPRRRRDRRRHSSATRRRCGARRAPPAISAPSRCGPSTTRSISSRSRTTRRSRSCSPRRSRTAPATRISRAFAWLVDDKYDGIRAQAHVTPERVSLFSRTLNDVAASYPEVVAALRALPGSFALDGEIVAVRDGRVLPFRFLQARLQRKDVSAELLREVPVRYVAFDLLAHDQEFLLDLPLVERRARLAEILAGAGDAIETRAVDDARGRRRRRKRSTSGSRLARARGHEGLGVQAPGLDIHAGPARQGVAQAQARAGDVGLRRGRRRARPRPPRRRAVGLHVRGPRTAMVSPCSAKRTAA